MDIAQDANDDTRQGWPGREYLSARAKKSARTIDRYIEALIKAGKLKCVSPSAPRHRAVYEIPMMFSMAPEPVDNPPSSQLDVRQNPSERATFPNVARSPQSVTERAPLTMSHVDTERDERAPLTMSHVDTERATSAMAHPPSLLPVKEERSVVTTSVEGTRAARGQDHHRQPSPAQLAAKQAEQSRRERQARGKA